MNGDKHQKAIIYTDVRNVYSTVWFLPPTLHPKNPR